MKTQTFDLGDVRVAVADEAFGARYRPVDWISAVVAERVGLHGDLVRAVVEVRQVVGGAAHRVLLGGAYLPGGLSLRVEVATSRETWRRFRGPSGRLLIPGLPPQLADAAIGGLIGSPIGPGLVLVDRAGQDRSTSSELVACAAEVLGAVLTDRSHQGLGLKSFTKQP
ncbi:MAG TPA: hypothetical protein VFE15_00620 [Marmoricola sp.]|nr:hypothetical protein [Marmoricola sp.]